MSSAAAIKYLSIMLVFSLFTSFILIVWVQPKRHKPVDINDSPAGGIQGDGSFVAHTGQNSASAFFSDEPWSNVVRRSPHFIQISTNPDIWVVRGSVLGKGTVAGTNYSLTFSEPQSLQVGQQILELSDSRFEFTITKSNSPTDFKPFERVHNFKPSRFVIGP